MPSYRPCIANNSVGTKLGAASPSRIPHTLHVSAQRKTFTATSSKDMGVVLDVKDSAPTLLRQGVKVGEQIGHGLLVELPFEALWHD